MLKLVSDTRYNYHGKDLLIKHFQVGDSNEYVKIGLEGQRYPKSSNHCLYM